MDKEYVKDMLESLYDDLEDIRKMVADLVNEPVCNIETEIEGCWGKKGILNYIDEALNDLKDIEKEINEDDEI